MTAAEGTTSELRIAIVAEHASLNFGGEAALPLHYFRVLRKRGLDAWLVTHARTREELLERFPGDEGRIRFVPDTWLHRALWRAGSVLPRQIQGMTFGLALRFLTQWLQKRMVRRLIREQGINIVHQPIPVSPKEPSLMYGLGVPVVIGPMNGGMEYPPAFRHLETSWIRHAVAVGRAASHFTHQLFPGKRQAAALLVANERTRKALPRGHASTVIECIENGVDVSLWEASRAVPRSSEALTRFIFVGRLVDWKAVDLLLLAFERARAAARISLAIVGDGPERARLESMARDTDMIGDTEVPGKIAFLGWRSQPECAKLLRQADAMVLPSLWECGGAVVLEAMSAGIPVVATDWGGPADYLDAGCGILVPPTTRDAFIDGLTSSMLRLADSADLRHSMGAAGQRKVRREFDWEVKVNRMLSIYRASLAAEPCGAPARA